MTSVLVEDFNPNHDELGRFAAGGESISGRPLTTREIKALTAYSRPANQWTSTGTDASRINGALRDGSFRQYQAVVAGIDSSFTAVVPLVKPAVVYRGIADLTTEFKVGQVYRDAAFVSTSLSKMAAKDFAISGEGSGAIAVIALPKGARVLNMAARGTELVTREGEQEVLLPRNARFKVISVGPWKKAGSEIWSPSVQVVHLEYLLPQKRAARHEAASLGLEEIADIITDFEHTEDYNPSHQPAGSPHGGEFAPGHSGGSQRAQEKAARVARALETHKPATAEKQRMGERQQGKIARALGGRETSDNQPVDVMVDLPSGKMVGIEVKTFIDQVNDKVTMHPDSLARKVSWARREKARLGTVVVDVRSGTPHYYARKGVGSFRLSQMTPIKLKDLKSMFVR